MKSTKKEFKIFKFLNIKWNENIFKKAKHNNLNNIL